MVDCLERGGRKGLGRKDSETGHRARYGHVKEIAGAVEALSVLSIQRLGVNQFKKLWPVIVIPAAAQYDQDVFKLGAFDAVLCCKGGLLLNELDYLDDFPIWNVPKLTVTLQRGRLLGDWGAI